MSNRLPMLAGNDLHGIGDRAAIRIMSPALIDQRSDPACYPVPLAPGVHMADRAVAFVSRATGPAALLAACTALLLTFA